MDHMVSFQNSSPNNASVKSQVVVTSVDPMLVLCETGIEKQASFLQKEGGRKTF